MRPRGTSRDPARHPRARRPCATTQSSRNFALIRAYTGATCPEADTGALHSLRHLDTASRFGRAVDGLDEEHRPRSVFRRH